MTNNCWHSIEAHFHDGAWRVLQSVLPIKAAKNSFMTDYTLAEVSFPWTHDQTSFTLRWRSFSWLGKEGIAICFAYKGSQNYLMTDYNLSKVWFPRTHDQKSLTLRCHPFSWCGREGIAISFACKGAQKLGCDWLQPIEGVISQDAWPILVDAPLTLSFLMGQGGYCYLFWL